MASSLVSVRVEGLNVLVAGLVGLGLDVEDLKDAFGDLAEQGAQIERAHVPVLTGALKADVRGNRAKNKAVVTAGRASVPYAGAINFGWKAHNITGVGFAQAVDAELGPRAPQIIQLNINDRIRLRGLG